MVCHGEEQAAGRRQVEVVLASISRIIHASSTADVGLSVQTQ